MDHQLAVIRAAVALLDEDRKQQLIAYVEQLLAEQNGAA